MGESLLTSLSMENLSTILSIDTVGADDLMITPQHRQHPPLSLPPDINLPLSAERSPPPSHWSTDPCDILDVGIGPYQIYDTDAVLTPEPAPLFDQLCAPLAGHPRAHAGDEGERDEGEG